VKRGWNDFGRHTWRIGWVAAFLLSCCAASGAELDAERFARWVEAEGGQVARDDAGRITDVYLGLTWAADVDIERMRPLAPHLQRLDLSLTYITDRGMEQLRTFTELRELNLFAAEDITDAGVAYLRGNKNLERLNLRGTDVTDVSMEYIATLANLKSLDVSFAQLNDTGLDHLASLGKLEHLALGGNKVSGMGLQVIRLLPNLKRLNLEGVQRRNAGYCWAASVTDTDLEWIGKLPALEELELGKGTGVSGPRGDSEGNSEAECRVTGGIKISDLGLARLQGLKKLRVLDISGSEITSAGLDQLAAHPHLEQLSLWGVAAIDDSAAPRLKALKSVTMLDLTDTAITDRTLEELAAMSGLRRLYVSGTRVTMKGIEAFRSRHPDCQLSWRSGLAGDPAE
jgi:Leucine-rich repeat (LRR) protein